MAKKYYTLLSRSPDDKRWCIEFGDYDRETVRSELEYCRDSNEDALYKIIRTNDDQASIDDGVADQNRLLKGAVA